MSVRIDAVDNELTQEGIVDKFTSSEWFAGQKALL
jgi:hypothetical protein